MPHNNSAPTRLVYILWPQEIEERGETQNIVINYVAPALLALGTRDLVIYAADPSSAVRSPAPRFSREMPAVAAVSILPGPRTTGEAMEKIFTDAGYRCAGYRVEETIYREYGGNRHAPPRDWEDGVRSPGITTVNLLERPADIPRDVWIERWYGTMSPVSEAMQPRARYVRNLVIESVTPEAPPFEGIVFESWPTKKHLSNPFMFYGAANVFQLIKNLRVMLHTVRSFLSLMAIQSYPMGEYFIKTGYQASAVKPPAKTAKESATKKSAKATKTDKQTVKKDAPVKQSPAVKKRPAKKTVKK